MSTKRIPSISLPPREEKHVSQSRDVIGHPEVTSSREPEMQKQDGFLSRIPEVTSSQEAEMTSQKPETDDEDEDVQVDVDDEEQLWD